MCQKTTISKILCLQIVMINYEKRYGLYNYLVMCKHMFTSCVNSEKNSMNKSQFVSLELFSLNLVSVYKTCKQLFTDSILRLIRVTF